jgi:hypothetical protein
VLGSYAPTPPVTFPVEDNDPRRPEGSLSGVDPIARHRFRCFIGKRAMVLGIATWPPTVFVVLMPYTASILPASVTVVLTVICIAVVGWAILGAKRR